MSGWSAVPVLQNVDGLLLVTEWKPFRNPDLAAMSRSMRQKIIFDGRNQYDPAYIREEGFEYFGVGRLRKEVVDSKV
jgi:UDPglucose 6-dehydrogenase